MFVCFVNSIKSRNKVFNEYLSSYIIYTDNSSESTKLHTYENTIVPQTANIDFYEFKCLHSVILTRRNVQATNSENKEVAMGCTYWQVFFIASKTGGGGYSSNLHISTDHKRPQLTGVAIGTATTNPSGAP